MSSVAAQTSHDRVIDGSASRPAMLRPRRWPRPRLPVRQFFARRRRRIGDGLIVLGLLTVFLLASYLVIRGDW